MNVMSSINKKDCLSLKWIFALAIFVFNTATAQLNNDSVFSASAISAIQLHEVQANKNVYLKEQPDKTFRLFVFLSPECPLCQNYSAKLNDLSRHYATNVITYGIIPGKAYSNDVIKKFIEQYNIQFPLLIDHDKKLTSYLHAVVTPQAILLNDKNQLVYKGAIDDWAVALGKQRVTTTKYYLRDALQQSLSDKTVLIKRTKAVGCRINDY
jgi:peroxiredoxin